MAFARPTLAEIIERMASDLASRITGSASALRRSVIRAIATAVGVAVHLVYGFQAYNFKQYFEDTAEKEYLERKASIWGLSRNAATFADGEVTFPGVDGTILPAGTILQRGDGVEYTVDADGLVASSEVTVSVTCQTAGDSGNMLSGETLNIATPITGITTQGVVETDGITGGTDEETDDALRERLLAKIQMPPRGGNADDYEAWAKEVSGVTRVWVYENQYGAGTVGVAFVRDNDSGSIIPSAGEVSDVQDYIDSVRPLCADVTVWAPTASALNFTISITPDTSAIRAAVQAELEDLIKRASEPGGTIYLSQIREAVSAAAGEVDNEVTSPSADVVASAGQLKTMGVITWV